MLLLPERLDLSVLHQSVWRGDLVLWEAAVGVLEERGLLVEVQRRATSQVLRSRYECFLCDGRARIMRLHASSAFILTFALALDASGVVSRVLVC